MGLSAETPTIVAEKREMKHSLGGAALVCRNLLELGAAVGLTHTWWEPMKRPRTCANSPPETSSCWR